MKKVKIIILNFLFISLLACNAAAQPFANEINQFKKIDSVAMPPANAILFTGSSSFRIWDSLQANFPEHSIINRAFGGSTLPDVIYYAEEVIFKYQPKQIFLYCGDNDFAADEKLMGKDVFKRFKTLYKIIRKKLPDVSFVYVAIKPSPSRQQLMPKMAEANSRIKKNLASKKNTGFVDVYSPMLNAAGNPRPELFQKDMLHMNAEGYKIWQKLIEPYLIK